MPVEIKMVIVLILMLMLEDIVASARRDTQEILTPLMDAKVSNLSVTK